VLSLAGLVTAVAAANTVAASHAGIQTIPITPNSLLPADCSAVVTVTRLVVGSGTFSGTGASELILGGAGSDTISGGGGSDCILGGGGNDTITAGSGSAAVVLMGGPGNDTLRGRNGNDWLYGGPGIDTLNGRGGADHCYGGGQVGDQFTRCEISGP